jgi:hypothetical protein
MSNIVKSEVAALEKYKDYENFVREYGQRILSVARDYKEPDALFELVDALSDEIPQKEALYDVLKRLNPERKGIVSEKIQAFHTDLRLFHGTGNDPNRPVDLIPGEMYYSSGEKVGKEFIGTPIFIWEGRELAEKKAPDDDAMPKVMCYSNDRKIGSHFGECQKCTYLPWRKKAEDEEKSDMYCRNYVNAFMLAQDGRELVLVRFKNTSEGAGRQLLKFAGRTPQLWYRWYSMKTLVQTSETNKKARWFIYVVGAIPGPEGLVPPALSPICDALYCAAGRDYVFPAIARSYANVPEEDPTVKAGETAGIPALVTPATDAAFGYGAINEDA